VFEEIDLECNKHEYINNSLRAPAGTKW